MAEETILVQPVKSAAHSVFIKKKYVCNDCMKQSSLKYCQLVGVCLMYLY